MSFSVKFCFPLDLVGFAVSCPARHSNWAEVLPVQNRRKIPFEGLCSGNRKPMFSAELHLWLCWCGQSGLLRCKPCLCVQCFWESSTAGSQRQALGQSILWQKQRLPEGRHTEPYSPANICPSLEVTARMVSLYNVFPLLFLDENLWFTFN